MSDRRRFLKGLTSLPLATVLANPRLAAAVSAGLQEVDAHAFAGRLQGGPGAHAVNVTAADEFTLHAPDTAKARMSRSSPSLRPISVSWR
jgi:hypothetical protein